MVRIFLIYNNTLLKDLHVLLGVGGPLTNMPKFTPEIGSFAAHCILLSNERIACLVDKQGFLDACISEIFFLAFTSKRQLAFTGEASLLRPRK